MLSSEIIATAFRLINLFIIIFIFIYLFRRSLKDIKFNISKLKNYFFSLNNRSDELEKRSKELDFEISYQEHLSKELLNKIHIWKESYIKESNQKRVEKDILNKKIEEKIKIQEKLLTQDKIEKDILKVVIENTRNNLVKEFKVEKNILAFQNQIMNFLK